MEDEGGASFTQLHDGLEAVAGGESVIFDVRLIRVDALVLVGKQLEHFRHRLLTDQHGLGITFHFQTAAI